MEVYILVENVSKDNFSQGPILGVFTFSALLQELSRLTKDDFTRIRLYDDRYGGIAGWLSHNVDDNCWLSIDIAPEEHQEENIWDMLGFKEEIRKFGILEKKLKE